MLFGVAQTQLKNLIPPSPLHFFSGDVILFWPVSCKWKSLRVGKGEERENPFQIKGKIPFAPFPSFLEWKYHAATVLLWKPHIKDGEQMR